MPYFVRGMEWRDYQDAYQHGLGLAREGKCLDPQLFRQGWAVIGAGSRLDARQAWSAVEHSWRMANGLDGPDKLADSSLSGAREGQAIFPRK